VKTKEDTQASDEMERKHESRESAIKKKSGPAEIHLKAIGHCQSIAHVGPHSCLTRLHSHVLRHSEKMCVQTAKRNCHILLHRQTSSPKITKIIQLGK
jgi:hypothetical protein